MTTGMRLLQAKQQIRVDNDEDRLVSQVALQYTRLMVLNLTNNINKFKYVIRCLRSSSASLDIRYNIAY